MKNSGSHNGEKERLSIENDEELFPSFSMSSFQAREEEIERKKMEMREKVEMQLGHAEEQSKRLSHVWKELEVLVDPMRKEVAIVRKRIDVVNRDLKSLGQSCQKKEKEYREALEAFNEKSSEKAQLTSTLMELIFDFNFSLYGETEKHMLILLHLGILFQASFLPILCNHTMLGTLKLLYNCLQEKAMAHVILRVFLVYVMYNFGVCFTCYIFDLVTKGTYIATIWYKSFWRMVRIFFVLVMSVFSVRYA